MAAPVRLPIAAIGMAWSENLIFHPWHASAAVN
jgi:hypothetical protein